MAKKIIALFTAFAMVFSMTACGSSSTDTAYNYDLSEYVKAGDYIGIEVERIDAEEVTDEMVESEIQTRLEDNATSETVTEGTVESGQTVNIDYEGKIDGETFDGGSAEGYDLIIGSGSFIDGFEDGLIGKSVGETVTLNLTFPEDYESDADLAGKAVEFTVTINSITEEVVPDLDEDFVKSVSDCKTVDEYKAEVKKELEEQAQESAQQSMMSAAWQTVYANFEILQYPETELAEAEQEMKDYYTAYAENYGMEFEDFLEMAGMTSEEFDEEAQSYAESSVGEELVMYYIVREEGIKVSNSEYKEGAQEYADNLGYESIDALEEDYTKETIEQSLLWEKFFEFLLENAKIVEPSEDTDTDTETTTDDTAAESTTESTEDTSAASGSDN